MGKIISFLLGFLLFLTSSVEAIDEQTVDKRKARIYQEAAGKVFGVWHKELSWMSLSCFVEKCVTLKGQYFSACYLNKLGVTSVDQLPSNKAVLSALLFENLPELLLDTSELSTIKMRVDIIKYLNAALSEAQLNELSKEGYGLKNHGDYCGAYNFSINI